MSYEVVCGAQKRFKLKLLKEKNWWKYIKKLSLRHKLKFSYPNILTTFDNKNLFDAAEFIVWNK